MYKKLLIILCFAWAFQITAQDSYNGEGPFNQLIIRGN